MQQYEMVRQILQKQGLAYFAKDIHGVNALVYATAIADTQMVEILLDNGFDVNELDDNCANVLMYFNYCEKSTKH